MWAKPNRYRVQHKGPIKRRCRRWKRWKKKYGSDQAATEAARSMAERFNETYTAFHCPHCGSWHVGRPPDDTEDTSEK